jgi:hypothetical protein
MNTALQSPAVRRIRHRIAQYGLAKVVASYTPFLSIEAAAAEADADARCGEARDEYFAARMSEEAAGDAMAAERWDLN